MDEHGQRLRDVIGPYEEGAYLTLSCEVDGEIRIYTTRAANALDELYVYIRSMLLKRSDMSRGPVAQIVDSLRITVNVAWQRLSQATINRLIDRMSQRIESCIAVATLDTE
ncbi:hypothetical protein TNCV_2096411 [Trichonephila clavipes]|nr:hypothetical protein TNCV_2096411 [Trichonephila clavipes]